MLLYGDEFGRSQRGNNNAYCQDNEISWFDWDVVDEDLFAFTAQLVAFRREHPTFRRRRWFQGRPIRGTVDIGWCRPDGKEMSDADWDAGFARSVGVFLNGDAIHSRDTRGQPVRDDTYLLLLNAHDEALDWTLPSQWGSRWEVVFDTSAARPEHTELSAEVPVDVEARSTILLVRTDQTQDPAS
jgi:glycogen operon protein